MQVSFFYILYLTILLSTVGCGSQGKTVNLNVSGSFSISAAGYTGGLIAYGEGPNGARFSVTSSEGSTLTTTIDDGVWNIFVIGWENTAAVPSKFHGKKYCGSTNVSLSMADTNVNVDVSPSNCSDVAFQSFAGVQEVLISSCGAFYNYAVTSNTYLPLTNAGPDNFCDNLPDSQKFSHPVYRLVANNVQGQTVSPGISSECLLTNVATNFRIGIPTKRVPFTVHTYQSMKDCQNLPVGLSENFYFPQGLDAGNQASFDHHFSVTTVPDARLILPSSKTRRGHSPFMNLLPRILCNSGDCFTAPETPNMIAPLAGKALVDVNWEPNMYDNRIPTLIRNIKPSTFSAAVCDSTLVDQLESSENFTVSSCQIIDGNLKANFARNRFNCKNSASTTTGMVDLYNKNDYIYSAHTVSINETRIFVHTKKALRLYEVIVSSMSTQVFKSFAVDLKQNLYLLSEIAGTTTLSFVGFDPVSKRYLTPVEFAPTYIAGATQIEVTDQGSVIVAVPGPSNQLVSFKLSTIAAHEVFSLPAGTLGIKKIQYFSNNLWVLASNSTNTNLYDYVITGTTVTWPTGTERFSAPTTDEYENFILSLTPTGRQLVFSRGLSVSSLEIFSVSQVNVLANLLTNSPTLAYARNVLSDEDNIYTLSGNTVKVFQSFKLNRTTNTIAERTDTDYCQAKVTPVIDGTSYQVNLTTRRVASVKSVFEDSFRFLGIRKIPSPQAPYYFRNLQSDDHDDLGRGEGMLNRASSMMSPDGIGGILAGLYPGKTCGEIKSMVSAAGNVSRSFTLSASTTQQSQTYSLSVSAAAVPVSEFLCTLPGCSTVFDLVILIRIPGKESTELKINCTEKLGSIESADKRDNRISHDLTLWNTHVSSSMRYESYEIEDRFENNLNSKRISLTKLQKSVENAVDVRSLELNREPLYIMGRISELALTTGGKIASSSIDTGFVPIGSFNNSNTSTLPNGKSVASIVQNAGFGPVFIDQTMNCILQSNPDPQATPFNCSTPIHNLSVTSKSPNLLYRLDSLETFSSGVNAPIYNIFSLNP